ncbi:MAG: GNAT family N-acetyltransferase [Methylobacteriaceae bacterium]|nr:GNAT family N-acetyltransferase [Methylobacteriaceae bacterium]
MAGPPVYGHGWRPGVIGDIVRLHAVYYAREWQLGAAFEAKVAAELGAFIESYDAQVSRLLTAHTRDRLLGALSIDGSSTRERHGAARLRWLILADEAHGRGIGKTLMQMAMDFLAETHCRACYLTTFAGLDAARALYERHGFRLTRETQDATWGRPLREQRFEWRRDE